jgi:hypothetical protein
MVLTRCSGPLSFLAIGHWSSAKALAVNPGMELQQFAIIFLCSILRVENNRFYWSED